MKAKIRKERGSGPVSLGTPAEKIAEGRWKNNPTKVRVITLPLGLEPALIF